MYNINIYKEIIMAKEYSSHSKFTAGAFANYFATLLVGLVSSITCGIATPWILCWYMRFIANHTFINGKQVIFDGSGGSLFGNYIKWLLLSFITFGIYWLVAGQVNLAQWLAKNTHLEGYDPTAESKSEFTGKWYQMWGVSWLVNLLISCTLGIGFPWAACYLVKWYASKIVIDGHEMEFDGRGGQLIGKAILWSLLTLITFGIYSFWLEVKIIKWLVSHIHLAHPEELASSEDVAGGGTDCSEAAATADATAAPVPQQSNTVGIVGFVLSLIGIFLPGLICCAIGLSKSKQLGGSGKGLSIAGIIISVLGILFYIGYIGFAVIMMLKGSNVGIGSFAMLAGTVQASAALLSV